jgi:hypothetical protein
LEKELSSLTIAGAHLDFREAQQRLDCIHSHAVGLSQVRSPAIVMHRVALDYGH